MTVQYTTNFGLALPDFRQGPWHDQVNGDFRKIDALLFSAMSSANVAPWANSTAYIAGANVIDADDATVWMCILNHTSAATGTFAADRSAHPTYWTRLLTGFAPRGEWARSTQYFAYDLAYDSNLGIMALCIQKHMSTATGSIVDDKIYWAFLLDMSDVGVIVATAVTYSNLASAIPKTNVQEAVDYIETQIVGLNNVNIKQGENIGPVPQIGTPPNDHPVKSLQVQVDDSVVRIGALETKTAYTNGVTAPYYTSTQNKSCQFGGSSNVGFYIDATNVAIRPPTTGGIYMQSQGGAANYAVIGSSGTSITGTLSATSTISTPGGMVGSSFQATGGGIYMGGWGGNASISVIFLNSANSHYIYHDGTNVSFAGVTACYAGNGRLWGNSDFGSVGVTQTRWVHAGDTSFAGHGVYCEINAAAITSYMGLYNPGYPVFAAARHRYFQVVFGNGGWVTVGFAS